MSLICFGWDTFFLMIYKSLWEVHLGKCFVCYPFTSSQFFPSEFSGPVILRECLSHPKTEKQSWLSFRLSLCCLIKIGSRELKLS